MRPISKRGESGGGNAMAFAKRLRRAGFDARRVAEQFVVLGADDARRLLDRMAGDTSLRVAYAVLQVATVDDAERFVLSLDGLDRGEVLDAAWSAARFFRWTGVGPLDAVARCTLFDRWIDLRLRRLYGGVLPSGVSAASFAALFGTSPDAATTDVFVQRRSDGPRVWLRNAGAATADVATCDRGRWAVQRGRPLPWEFRTRRPFGMWALLAPLLLMVALSWLVRRMVRPLERLDDRQRRGRLQRARLAAGVAKSVDGESHV